MNNYELYIDGTKADLNEDNSKILLTFQRTDYTNPTIVKNSYSKTITLPGTPNNNAIFNSIYRLDRIQTSSTFNPSKRVGFKLYKSGNLLEAGYIKLDKVVKEAEYNSYEITLYGELGTILYKLTYNYSDASTSDNVKLSLANLGFESLIGFNINRETIREAWLRLDNLDAAGSTVNLYDTINFCVAYNGIPDAENFDPSMVAINTAAYSATPGSYSRTGAHGRYVLDGNTMTGYSTFDGFCSWTDDDVTYSSFTVPQASYSSSPDTQRKTAILEMDEDATDLEMRDLRSYLQRPVIRLKKVFDAIGTYMTNNLGYTLDLSDPFFSTDEYKKAWITLSMLYEVKPDVQSDDYISMATLLSNTSDPASYLISYCKIYGIYIDIDIIDKKVILTRTPNFYLGNVREEPVFDESSITVTPLSFDKNSYTFDYAEGESDFQTYYNDTYNFQYGSKKVKTGFEFNAESEQYIQNNVFRNGIDAIETSKYYRTGWTPQPLAPTNSKCQLTLFATDSDTGETLTSSKEIYAKNNDVINYYTSSGAKANWAGLKKGAFQDYTPRLQCHGEDNSASDGKDILVMYTGKVEPDKCYWSDSSNSFVWTDPSGGYFMLPNYVISDDIPSVKAKLGKNCWISFDDNYDSVLYPTYRCDLDYKVIVALDVYPSTTGWHRRLIDLPNFTRCKYNQTLTSANSNFTITDSLDFSEVRELAMASTVYDTSSGMANVIYNKYWKNFISDMYSINTKVIEGRVRLDNITDAFRKFYYFDNCYWILSKLTDYDYDTMLTTAQFIKVNDIGNYSNYIAFNPSKVDMSANGGSFDVYVEIGGITGTPTLTSDSAWLIPGSISSGKFNVSVAENTGAERIGTITATLGNYSETLTVKQSKVHTATLTVNATPDTATITLT